MCLQGVLSVWGDLYKCFLFGDSFEQHHSDGCQHRGCWDSSGRSGHHGHRADVCGPAHRRHHTHHRGGLVPVSMLGLWARGPGAPLCRSRAPHSLACLPKRLLKEGQLGKKLNCLYFFIPPTSGDQAPGAMCVHSLISLWGTRIWLLHLSLHKAIQGLGNPVCKANSNQQGLSELHNIPRAVGTELQASHAGSSPASLCFPFHRHHGAQTFPSELSREPLQTVGRELAS